MRRGGREEERIDHDCFSLCLLPLCLSVSLSLSVLVVAKKYLVCKKNKKIKNKNKKFKKRSGPLCSIRSVFPITSARARHSSSVSSSSSTKTMNFLPSSSPWYCCCCCCCFCLSISVSCPPPYSSLSLICLLPRSLVEDLVVGPKNCSASASSPHLMSPSQDLASQWGVRCDRPTDRGFQKHTQGTC